MVNERCAHFQLDTLVGYSSHIAQYGVKTRYLFYGHIEQQVGGLLVVGIEGHRQTAVEETRAQANVIRGRGLPLQVGVRLVRDDIARGSFAADNDGARHYVGGKLIVANLLIAHHADRGAQLDEVYLLAQPQPFLAVDVPRQSQRGEPSPAMILSEAAAAVGAQCQRGIVARGIGVVHAPYPRLQCRYIVTTGRGLRHARRS